MPEEKETKHEHRDHKSGQAEKPKAQQLNLKKWLLPLVGVVLAALVAAWGYVYTVSPAAIRSPKMEHYHFRMQVVVDGQDVDFSKPAFQTPYVKGQCSAELSDEPMHFHDGNGQFVHIHWRGLNGGIVLKNYGWNYINGKDNILGYRTDHLPKVQSVPIHGAVLPDVPEGADFWVYTGDEHDYQKRSFEDFKGQGLEHFFEKDSNFPKTSQGSGVMGWLFPRASAHGNEMHEPALTGGDETDGERLTRINNLLGNIVIFVQKTEPSQQQIKARFANLQPLSDSTCGG